MNTKIAFTIATILLLILLGCFLRQSFVSSQTDNLNGKLQAVNNEVNNAFNAILNAEKDGVNTSDALNQLSNAASLLASAQNEFRTGDVSAALSDADSAGSIAQHVTALASDSKHNTLYVGNSSFLLSMLTVVVIILFFSMLYVLFKKKPNSGTVESRRSNNYKMIAVAAGIIVVLLVTSLNIASFTPSPQGEQFIGIYVLGPGHTVGNYPANVIANNNYSFYIGASNHFAYSQYGIIFFKILNSTDVMPSKTLITHSLLEPIYEYRFLSAHNQTVESQVTFSLSTIVNSNNIPALESISINNLTVPFYKPTAFNSDNSQSPYTLLLELWVYNSTSGNFQYNNQFMTLQLYLS